MNEAAAATGERHHAPATSNVSSGTCILPETSPVNAVPHAVQQGKRAGGKAYWRSRLQASHTSQPSSPEQQCERQGTTLPLLRLCSGKNADDGVIIISSPITRGKTQAANHRACAHGSQQRRPRNRSTSLARKGNAGPGRVDELELSWSPHVEQWGATMTCDTSSLKSFTMLQPMRVA